MLNKIIIQGFQSHENTNIDLNEITIFHGLSDSGKSAIKKALNSVVHKNAFYMRNKATEGKVCLIFDDFSVERDLTATISKFGERKVKSDVYKFEVPSENINKSYERFGNELPQEISDKIKMPVYKIGSVDVDFNVMNQFDDLFFIGESYNPIRDKMINMLVPDCETAVEEIDKLRSDKNELCAEKRYFKSSLEKLETQKSQFDELIKKYSFEKLKAIYDKLEQTKVEIDKIDDKINALKRLMVEYERNKLSNINLDKYKTKLNEIKEKYKTYQYYQTEIYELNEIKRTNFSLITIDIDAIMKNNFDKLRKSVSKFNDLCEDISSKKKFIVGMKTLYAEMTDTDERLEKTRKYKEDIEKEVKANNICVITGKPYKPECLLYLKK